MGLGNFPLLTKASCFVPLQGKLVQLLRNVQTEQFSKLQQRYQLQTDLLEDVRSYMKQKSGIERDYAQALQKLNAQYTQKRDYSVEDESDQNLRSPLKVWKSYLDQMEDMAKRRITVAEKAQTDVADKIKTVKSNKMTTFKKSQDLFQRIYEELNLSLREMSKCRKAYMELQKLAEIAEKETGEAQDKLKKGETFFKSKATLEKNFSKSSERREICVRQANASRNEYLLSLAALNGHMKRFREIDLTQILKDLDADFYEQMKEYHTSASLMEVEAGLYGQDGFNAIVSNAGLIDRNASITYFLEKNAMFQNKTTYAFEPYGEDKVSTITTDSTVALAVDKEARKLATKYVREQRSLKNKFSKMNALESSQTDETSAPADGQEPPLTVEGLQEAIRKVEVSL
ncbi:Hypothetical predicted protein [Paramuricea clavata]|uniref:Uncharacterized protein n=1 Tax=Paramuricea clavata TaxID=317549 RepID=A0A7D9DR00_PARCT|nr:Hypothetical predicted protein [Paramuricea clavata]